MNSNIKEKFTELLLKAKNAGVTGQRPFNCVTGHLYNGCNLMLLAYVSSLFKGCTAFLTFKQVESLGGSVKGQKGFPVSKIVEIEDKETGKKRKVLKYYTVFNLRQVHRRELDVQEYECKQGKRQSIDSECYAPVAVPFNAPDDKALPLLTDDSNIPF